ncbi:MAG: TIGR00268 family protein, partial [Deltaproteobacteria bacterium]|nr:TIGR00268 family protein [Deltaproteobacteria bacterium]
LGFRVFRVRYHDTVARIELAPEDLPRMLSSEVREVVTRRFRDTGFSYVSVDLQGYRQGAMNEAIKTVSQTA